MNVSWFAIVRQFCFFSSLLLLSPLAFSQNALDMEAGKTLYDKACASCHGIDGNMSSIGAFPKLAGQHTSYLRKELIDYQKNQRSDPIMTPIAKKLSLNDLDNLLAYINGFTPQNGEANPALLAQGEHLFRGGDKAVGIPACAACHAPDGVGNDEALYPHLAGQNSIYVNLQLQNFHDQKRTNDPKQMMQMIAAKLTPEDMNALASYINGQRP